jgi:nitrile hydratase
MRVLQLDNVQEVLRAGDSARLPSNAAARFKPGDAVRTRNFQPPGHTRLPRYARAKHGVVAIDHGVFVFPDTHAASGDKKPQHLYSVRFTMRELWGEGASDIDTVHMDMFDDYLQPA